MAAPTTSSAVRIAARRMLLTASRPQCSNNKATFLQASPFRLQQISSRSVSPLIPRSQQPTFTGHQRPLPLTRPTPFITTASPLPPLIHNVRRYGANVCNNNSNKTSDDSSRHQKQNKTDSNSRDGPKRNDQGKFTLYAGVSLVSVLFALSQPLSYIHVGHHDDDQDTKNNDHDHDGSKKINTGSRPPPPPSPSTGDDQRDPNLPRFRLADVRKHDANSGSPWVTSGDKVYDITDWVAAHPGGDVILRAAGHSIDPYWAIFTIHKAPHVREILDSYLIGFVDVLDLDTSGQPKIVAGEGVEDPFAADPKRDSRLTVHTQKPCNAEPAPPQLARDFTTPNELFYVRNHMWVPVVERTEADQHKLTVELPDGEVRAYTLDELRSRFKKHTVTAVMQCSGNRRSDMTRTVGKTNGLQWGAGAISNAVWEGVLLKDVLADAGLNAARSDHRPKGGQKEEEEEVPPDGLHVQLTGMEAYAASIPLPAALDPRGEVLLAYAMNGQPLPRDHGYPLRAVVPGFVAARSVKWLSKIVVSDEESQSQWQRRDYKLFGPNEGGAPDWDKYPAIQEMPVTSAVTGVWVGQKSISKAVKEGHLTSSFSSSFSGTGSRAVAGVRDLPAWQKEWKTHVDQHAQNCTPVTATGYAYSGGGREIVRVDVSVDGGRTWDQATLLDQKQAAYDDEDDRQKRNIVARGRRDFAWKRWRYDGVLLLNDSDSPSEVVVKATDSAYNTQPERHDGIYNVRGNLATAWHRVKIGKDQKLQGCGFDKSNECKK